jgi:dGTPase
MSRALGLNEDLTEAIALGHDLGHAPFGHVGENALRTQLEDMRDRQGFEHNEHSLIIVDTTEESDTLEGRRPGMNLTVGTRQGILCHTRYTEKDYGDRPKPIPEDWEKELGYSSKEQRDVIRMHYNLSFRLRKLRL